MKSPFRRVIWVIVFIIIAAFIFNFYQSGASERRIAHNNREFNYQVENLAPNQTVLLADITPFEWDYLYIFGPYQNIRSMQRVMGIENDCIREVHHEAVVSLYFLLEGGLVARIIRPNGYIIDFGRSNQIVAIRDNPEILADTIYRNGLEWIRISWIN